MTETGAAGPLTGWQLGGWTLENLLGSGGMGSVYRATREGDQAAIKVLSAQLAWDEELQKRFQREIKIAAGLRSGRVARLLEAETDGPVPWFATELIEGPTLEDVVVDRGPLAGEELRAFAEGLARAVDDLAQAGVVHRDIKPSNVILTDWSPILLDFGVATTPQSTQLTATGIALGTPVWMSPEQLVGRPVSRPSDVFSWATTTAYAGTGRHPFGPGELEEIAHRIVRGGPDLGQVDPGLRRILQRAMAKDPKARPKAIDLVHAVSRVAMGPESGVERTTRMSPLPPAPRALPRGQQQPVRPADRRAGRADRPEQPYRLSPAALQAAGEPPRQRRPSGGPQAPARPVPRPSSPRGSSARAPRPRRRGRADGLWEEALGHLAEPTTKTVVVGIVALVLVVVAVIVAL